MNQKAIQKGLIIILAIIGLSAIVWWLNNDPTNEMAVSLPGGDNRGVGVVAVEENIIIGEHFQNYSDNYTRLTETWSRFRGVAP